MAAPVKTTVTTAGASAASRNWLESSQMDSAISMGHAHNSSMGFKAVSEFDTNLWKIHRACKHVRKD